jgi:hypothetical protein
MAQRNAPAAVGLRIWFEPLTGLCAHCRSARLSALPGQLLLLGASGNIIVFWFATKSLTALSDRESLVRWSDIFCG